MKAFIRQLAGIFLLFISVLIHEGGHYVAMKANGVRVVEFSLGVGPALWRRALSDGEVFTIRILPIAAYVETVVTGHGGLSRARLPSRLFIAFAGIMSGLLAAVIVLVVIRICRKDEPAFVGDYAGWLPRWCQPLSAPIIACLMIPVRIFQSLRQKPGDLFSTFGGPVGIISVAAQIQSLPDAARFFILLNIAIASFNMLPLMPLDGGQAVFAIINRFDASTAQIYMAYSIYPTMVLLGVALLSDILLLLACLRKAVVLRKKGRLSNFWG